MLKHYCFFPIIILLALAIVGCGGNVGLRGTVVFSDDGSPVTAGMIAFLKDGKIARGTIREDGTYIVGFEREADGLPPGRYEVFLTADVPVGETSESLIDLRYSRPETSGITIDVDASTKVFNLEVERFKK